MCHFMLAILAAISGAIAGGVFTAVISQQKIKSEVRASTRLEWIKEVRELTARIINSYYQIQRYYNSAVKYLPPSRASSYQNIDDYKNLENELISLSNDITLFKLYFSTIRINPVNVEQPNKENIYMRKLADQVKNESTRVKIALDGPMKHRRKFKNIHINKFSNFTSDYLKKEWDRAKNNR